MEQLVLLVTFLAYANEQAIEHLVGQWKAKIGPFMVYLAAAVGIAEAFILKVNALPLVGVETNAIFGYLVTGLAIGGLSNILHRFVGKPSRNNGE